MLNDDGNFLTFQEFTDKYPCKTNFLHAIPKDLLLKAKSLDSFDKSPFVGNDTVFNLNNTLQIHLERAKSRVFYKLLNDKINTEYQTGPQKWIKYLSVDDDSWTKIFKSLRKVCKETKLKEFQFKLIHRIVVTKKELFKYGIKDDDKCLYCGERDSIEHTLINCLCTKTFMQKTIQWFNMKNSCQISPTPVEILFGITSHEKSITRKFNYTSLLMHHYIYSSKLNNKVIAFEEFIDKLLMNYSHEDFC